MSEFINLEKSRKYILLIIIINIINIHIFYFSKGKKSRYIFPIAKYIYYKLFKNSTKIIYN